MPVLFAAQYAYVGPATLAVMRQEWGVEVVAAPGQEVDPGLLQLKRVTPGNALSEDGMTRVKDIPTLRRLGSGRRNEAWNYRRGVSSRIVYDDQFGDLQTDQTQDPDAPPFAGAPLTSNPSDAVSGSIPTPPQPLNQQRPPQSNSQARHSSAHSQARYTSMLGPQQRKLSTTHTCCRDT
nr:hypothetical protein B0A51_07565 [Rachicladosporium sp. CCFEE 5018]